MNLSVERHLELTYRALRHRLDTLQVTARSADVRDGNRNASDQDAECWKTGAHNRRSRGWRGADARIRRTLAPHHNAMSARLGDSYRRAAHDLHRHDRSHPW